MSTIQNIPEELLLDIFSNLSRRDLLKCQRVCRAWYVPAHIKLLGKVQLKDIETTSRFINAFDQNSNPRFLAAVKEIDTRPFIKNWKVSTSIISKLFFRFPNLKSVIINGTLLNQLDDDLCREFLQHCPKLCNLQVQPPFYNEKPLRIKVRLLLTTLILYDKVDNIEQYVTSFPRLKVLESRGQLKTFKSLLPILASLSNLQIIKLEPFRNGTDQFLERYLQQKTPDEGDQLLERISQIKELEIGCSTVLSRYVLEFIAKYMTGLEQLSINNRLNNKTQKIQLYYAMIDLVRSIKNCRFSTTIPMNVKWECLPQFMRHAVQDSSREKILSLYLTNAEQSMFMIHTTDKDIYMQVTISDEGSHIQPSLYGDILELDTFELDFALRKSMSMQIFDAFFNTKSTLKEVRLRVPPTIHGEQAPLNDTIAENHTSVEKLTIVSASTATSTVESILDRCLIAFPNLKILSLEGNWLHPKYLLDLSKFKLEKLVINVLSLSGHIKKPQLQLHKFYLRTKNTPRFMVRIWQVMNVEKMTLCYTLLLAA